MPNLAIYLYWSIYCSRGSRWRQGWGRGRNVVVKGNTVIYIKDAKCLFLKGEVKSHGLEGGERVRNVVNNCKGACEVNFDICRNADSFGISKRGKKTFPHVIIGGAGYGCPKWVKVRPGCLNSANP